MGDEQSNKQLLRGIFDAWAGGDIAPLIGAMADDFRWVFPGEWSWAGVWAGKERVVDGLLRGALGPQLDGAFENHADLILADGDRVVVQTRGRGQTKRGEAYNNTYCMIFRVRDGELTEVIEHCDTALVERVLDPPTNRQIAHAFDGHEQVTAARCASMKTIRTWLAFRREGRGYSLIKVARGWQ